MVTDSDISEQQERQDTTWKLKVLKHTDDDRFFVNMHALHNAALIRETLPRNLTAPKPFFEDRRAEHDKIAAWLRISGPAKRAETQRKQKETREKNKNKRVANNTETSRATVAVVE